MGVGYRLSTRLWNYAVVQRTLNFEFMKESRPDAPFQRYYDFPTPTSLSTLITLSMKHNVTYFGTRIIYMYTYPMMKGFQYLGTLNTAVINDQFLSTATTMAVLFIQPDDA